MANSIALAKVYLGMLDEIYADSAKTAVLDNPQMVRDTQTAGTVMIPKITMQGLGSYGRNAGFAAGDVTLAWETHTLTQDRGRSFQVDAMDNTETIDVAFGKLAGEFVRTKVTPEIDAYRFATMAGLAGNVATPATLTKSTIWTAIDTATETMDEAEVPAEGRILFINPANYTFLRQSDNFVRNVQVQGMGNLDSNIETYNGMRVVVVPTTRFYTKIDLYDGTTAGQEAGSYIKNAATGKGINFMIVSPAAVLGVKKHITPRIFDPATNQDADAWKFQYRIYHDLFVPDNKTDGIYLHNLA